MADRDNTPSTTADPAWPANTHETTSPSDYSPQDIQKAAQRIFASLPEEKRARVRDAVMRTMIEEQRRRAAATKKDPLIQFIFQKARSDIIYGNKLAQVDVGQQQQQQQQQQGTVMFTSLSTLMTQVSHNGINTAAATNSSRNAPEATTHVDSNHD